MKKFNFSYDEVNDDLFVYLEDNKSKGAVEMGNFVFDFDEQENLVAIQIFEASKILSKIISKIIELTKIREIKAEITNFRNMTAMKIKISTDSSVGEGIIAIPSIKEHSPALIEKNK